MYKVDVPRRYRNGKLGYNGLSMFPKGFHDLKPVSDITLMLRLCN